MGESIRNRCKVLQAIAIHGPCTTADILDKVEGLTPQQVQRAAYALRQTDEVIKVGERAREGSNGRPMVVLQCNDAAAPIKKTGKKKGRFNHSQALQVSSGGFSGGLVRYRERKVRLLRHLLDLVGGTDRDLLIGIIKDYEV